MNTDTNDLVSVTDASNGGVSRLASAAENGRPQVLLRNNKPIAAVVDISCMDRLQHIDDLEDDLRLLSIALVRAAADNGRRYTLDDVISKLGIDTAEITEDDET